MQLYAGKLQRIGAQLYPSSTMDLTIIKTISTFSDYRFFYRMPCILKKQWYYYENRWLKKLCDLSLLNELLHEQSCFCISENKGTDYLCGDQLFSTFIFNLNTIQSLFFLKSNFQAYSHLLCLYSPVYV